MDKARKGKLQERQAVQRDFIDQTGLRRNYFRNAQEINSLNRFHGGACVRPF